MTQSAAIAGKRPVDFRLLRVSTRLCACALALAFAGAASAQSSRAAAPASVGAAASGPKVSPFRTQKMTHKAQEYYMAAWGVDKLKVSYTSSGNLIRFSYRVSDAERAKALANKTAAPYLYGQRAQVVLHVPNMDQVGQLRQSAGSPQVGMEYWMVFSNAGNRVRPGDRVNVLIGSFHADGLMVE
jgi:hypothetical protein